MKKVAATLMGLVLCVGFVGCGHTVPEEIETEKPGSAYSHVWTASESDVKHTVGDLAQDAGWGSILKEQPGALCSVETATLNAPAYKAAARLLVNDDNLSSKEVAAVLRVLDANGRELGKELVRVCDFNASLTYQDFEFTFAVEQSTAATFEIYWPGTNYVRVSEFGIMSKRTDSLPDFNVTGEAILGADIAEDGDIAYEEGNLYFFDLYNYMQTQSANAEDQYDIANLVSTLQGLVNRDDQRLYIRFVQENGFNKDTDTYWLDYLTKEGNFLAEKNVVTVKSPMTLLKIFDGFYKGFAAWDPAVPATVNAVATACGVEDLLPVRYSTVRNSLYWYVSNNEAFAEKPVSVDLGGKFTGEGKIYGTQTDSTGSRKNDVYVWAKEQYLDTHKTNSHLVAYHVDAYGSNTVFAAYSDLQNMYLSNRDYYVANKAFFFDLSPMAFEAPDDDPDQADYDNSDYTTDFKTFQAVMGAQSKYAESVDATTPIDVGGFTPWHLKYTRYTNPDASGEVACEWTTVREFSVFNAYINADAPHYTAMANASVFMNYPMQETYRQTASKEIKETLPASDEQGVNYLMFFMGDFDASAWLNTAMTQFWADTNRGKIPLCWPFSLNISGRAGHVIDMMYNSATENDYFIAGDNGVGYLNPESFAHNDAANYYGDLDSWAAYNKTVYERFDIDFTGFLITEATPSKAIIECYAKFCKGVALNQTYANDGDGFVNGIEVVHSTDYPGNAQALASQFTQLGVGAKSTFTQIRFILRSPTDVYELYQQLQSDAYKGYNFKVVDPYTFYGLLAQQNGRAAKA